MLIFYRNTPLVYASSITSSIGGAAKRLSSSADKATAKKKKTERKFE